MLKMNKMKTMVLLMLLPGLGWAQRHGADVWKPVVSDYSPDSSVFAQAYLTHRRTLALDIYVDGKPLLNIDSIGLTTDKGNYHTFGKVGKETTRAWLETRTPTLWGERKGELRRCHMLSRGLPLGGGTFCFYLYVADNGVGFSFATFDLPMERVRRETTRYGFPCDGTSWSIPANFESYEFLYREQPVSQTQDANTPFTFGLDNGLWGSIHEGEIDDYPEMTLVRDGDLTFGTWLCPSADREHDFAIEMTPGRWHQSPIRAITIGRRAEDLANNTFVPGLFVGGGGDSLPQDYIRALKYIGIWWGMHLGINDWTPGARHGATTANALRYIDFAADNNIDAVLLEGWNRGWETWGRGQHFAYTEAAEDMDMDSVCRYARRRGVEIIIHHETGGNWKEYEQGLDSVLDWCVAHGIHAIKTGYAGGFPDQDLHHSRVGVNHYNRVMRKAAERGVMLDVHEPIKPSGWNYRWPNLMTGEGVRGQEWNAWSDGNPPSHTCTLPFTRGLAGPTDYTPGIFDINYDRIKGDTNVRKWNMKDARECGVHTTLCHQMALWVVLYSPWQMAADLIENYEGHECFQFFRDLDPDCDWSHMMEGMPGQYVVTVRRAKGRYFIGAITNEEARDVELPLDFLPEGMDMTATIYADGEGAHYETHPTAYAISSQRVDRHSVLRVHLAPGGGCAMVIEATK